MDLSKIPLSYQTTGVMFFIFGFAITLLEPFVGQFLMAGLSGYVITKGLFSVNLAIVASLALTIGCWIANLFFFSFSSKALVFALISFMIFWISVYLSQKFEIYKSTRK
jgi:hypothetical protein